MRRFSFLLGIPVLAGSSLLAACSKDSATQPTQPPGPTTGTLVVTADQASCLGLVQRTAEIFVNGQGQPRFQLNSTTRVEYPLSPGQYSVSVQINGIALGTPQMRVIVAGQPTSFIIFCV